MSVCSLNVLASCECNSNSDSCLYIQNFFPEKPYKCIYIYKILTYKYIFDYYHDLILDCTCGARVRPSLNPF